MTDWATKANWLWAAGLFTVVYLIGALWIVGPVRVWTFITTGDLNEIGDFLAGVFSPLAFIWLVAAVLTQRQELDETRDQFGENQKVVDAQMKTISSQNELLALQHQQADASAKQTYKLNLFERRLSVFEELNSIDDAVSKYGLDWTVYERIRRISLHAAFVFNRDIEQQIFQISLALGIYLREHSDLLVSDGLGNFVLTSAPEDAEALDALRANKDAIVKSLGREAMLKLMWSSMRVSDD